MKFVGRDRNWASDIAGASFAFVIEMAIVVGLALIAIVLALAVLAVF